MQRLQVIAAAESATVPDHLLHRIARAASGGMRDAQTLLDQLIAVSGGNISEEDFNLLLGAARGEDIASYVSHLGHNQTQDALAVLDELFAAGAAGGRIIEQVLDRLRQMMLITTCGADHVAVKRLGQVDEDLVAQARHLGTAKSLRACQIFIKAGQAIRGGVDPRLQLELATVHVAELAELADMATLVKQLQRLEASPGGPNSGR